MTEIVKVTARELIGIPIAVIRSIFKDLLFPSVSVSLEDQIVSKVRDQYSTIRDYQDRFSYQRNLNQQQGYKINNLETLLIQRDKEVKQLADTIRYLEIQLSKSTNHR